MIVCMDEIREGLSKRVYPGSYLNVKRVKNYIIFFSE